MTSVADVKNFLTDYSASFIGDHHNTITDNYTIACVDMMRQDIQQVLELSFVKNLDRGDAICPHRFHWLIDCTGASAKNDCYQCKK